MVSPGAGTDRIAAKERKEFNREWIRRRQAYGVIRQPPDE
jgi:hypothetical protein